MHVTLDGEHIPGSIFHVVVLEQQSLGGEGKIRVFYSTTSAKSEKTRPLQELLEVIHRISTKFLLVFSLDFSEEEDSSETRF